MTVELRWLERTVWYPSHAAGPLRTERVLQYRYMTGPHGNDWWSDWTEVPVVQDVPTVGGEGW